MKKLLAILMALTVCGAVAYSVGAEDGESVDATTVTEEATVAAEETTVTVTKSPSEIIKDLANDPGAQDIANKLKDALATGKGDIPALLASLGKYVNGQGFDVKDLQDAGALNEVILGFLDDAGIDADALDKAIGDSTIAQKVLELYYKPEATTTVAPTTTGTTVTTATTYSNPDTGSF